MYASPDQTQRSLLLGADSTRSEKPLHVEEEGEAATQPAQRDREIGLATNEKESTTMKDRDFDSDGLRPADAGYGKPEPRQMTAGRGRAIKKALRMSRNRVASRQKSRRGLGKRRYR